MQQPESCELAGGALCRRARRLAGVGSVGRLLVWLVGLVGAAGVSVGSAGAAFPGRVGVVAWVQGDELLEGEGLYLAGGPRGRVVRVGPAGKRLFLRHAVWSPDGRRLAVGIGRDFTDESADPDLTELVAVVRPGEAWGRRLVVRGASPAWSPDGTRLVVESRIGRGQGLVVVDVRSRRSRVLVRGRAWSPAWSPDGRWIAFTRGELGSDYVVWLVRPDGTGLRELSPGLVGRSPDFSPDGTRVVTSWESRELTITSVATGRRRSISIPAVEADAIRPDEPAWSPDGRRIVFALVDRDPADGQEREDLSVIGADASGYQRWWRVRAKVGPSRLIQDPDWQPVCTIYGTSSADVLRGTPGKDVICGLAGDDRIDGRGGDDVIQGGDGNDTLTGGPGEDWLFGGYDDDRIEARDGERDIADGGPGKDALVAEEFDERR